MSNTKKRHSDTKHPVTPQPNASKFPWWSWLAIGIPILGLIALVIVGGQAPSSDSTLTGDPAPAFELPTTLGTNQSLAAVLATGNEALLYFSMGPGCDGCFTQIPEAQQALADRGITLVPIMVDPAPLVSQEAARFGITDPILIDLDLDVSNAYDMVGIYGHANRPSHSFALVGTDQQIKWVKHYAEMFVPIDQLLADMGLEA